MSSSLTAGRDTVTFGRLRPCREATLPPTSTFVTTSPSVHLAHPKANGAVGQVQDVSLVHQVGEALPGDRQPLGRALHGLGRQHHLRVTSQLGHAAGHRADPELGAGQVAEDRHVASRALGSLADRRRYLGVLLRAAVREVEPGDVHARLDHLLEDLRVLGGWADRRDDLRRAHAIWTLPTKSPLLATELPETMLTLRLGEVLMGPGLRAVRKACLALLHTLPSTRPQIEARGICIAVFCRL